MWQIFIGSIILSIIHALIPNHWLPLIAIAKAEKWSKPVALMATLVSGLSHVLSSLVIGLILGIIGYKLSKSYTDLTEVIAATILVIMGIIYIILDLRKHSHHHEHFKNPEKLKKKSPWAIIMTLSIAMFFTPCLEIEAYYFKAGIYGWSGILLVSLVYLVITLLIMSTLVYLGLSGINKFKSHFLEHHDKLLSGLVLLVLGIVAYFVKY
ncbi:MAG: hypothetical protein WCR42_10805 [bacterium]